MHSVSEKLLKQIEPLLTFDHLQNYCCLILLFAMFVKCKYYPYREVPRKGQVANLRLADDEFSKFYAFCQKIKGYFDSDLPSANSTQQESSNNPSSDDDDDEELHTGRRSRSRAIK